MKKSGLVLKNALVLAIFVSGLLWVAGFFLIHSTAHATTSSVVDEVTVNVPASCSLNSTVGTAHIATIETGAYTDDIGETTINAFCNDAEGFSIYTVGYTNGEFGNNTMKPGTVAGTNAIATGLATSGDTSNWAMKLTSMSENFTLTNDFGSYHIVPDVYTKVATYPSNTTTTAGVNIKSTYAAYISAAQLADSYNGKVKYVVLHPASKQPVTDISDLTTMQDFKDLSSDERITVAMSMQERTTYELVDTRDNKTYQIAKMKDGNIWMAENLDLGRTELTTDLTSENSNLAETVTAETFNGWKVLSGSSSYAKGEYVLNSGTEESTGAPYGTLYNYYATTGGTVSGGGARYLGHDICPAGWRIPAYTKDYELLLDAYGSDSASMFNSVADGGVALAHAGEFYSYYPSMLGDAGYYWTSDPSGDSDFKILYFYGSRISTSSQRQYAGASIRCIAKKPEHALTISYGEGVASVTLNDHVVADGETIETERDTVYKIGMIPTEEHYFGGWSATAGGIEESRYQYSFYTMAGDATLSTWAVPVNTEMQNLPSSSCTTTPSRVYDNRDGHVYTIQRLPSGDCWMIENLELGHAELTTDLTSQNSNLSTTVAASTFNSWKGINQTYNAGAYITVNGGDMDAGVPYGTLYNFYAASGGTRSGTSISNDATDDICPAGWRLPSGGKYSEVNDLFDSYDSLDIIGKSVFDGGPALTKSGSFVGSTNYPVWVGENSFYWTFSRSGEGSMYAYTTSSYNTSLYRYWASSIRCMMKKPVQTITVSYGEGVSKVIVNGSVIANGGSFTAEQGTAYKIDMDTSPRYTFNSWSSTGGNIINSGRQETYYKIGTTDATLSVSVTYVDTEMQNLSSSSCTTALQNVYDNRDGHVYKIARLLDGNCWMIDNLDLGRTELTTDLTSQNTNLSTTVTAATFNSWNRNSANASSSTAGYYEQVNGMDNVNDLRFGSLYNYCATSAGTICASENYDDAEYDICPAGWRLPTGGNSGEFKALYDLYNPGDYSITLMRAPVSSGGASFAFAGGSYGSVNQYGWYWSSTYGTNSGCMHLLKLYTYANTSEYIVRYYKNSIRCVLK